MCGNTEEILRILVPHGRKWQKLCVYKVGRGNAFALVPQYSHQGPLTRGPFTRQPSSHVSPLTGVRVDPRGLLPCVRALCATCASRGLSRPCHVALRVASHLRGSRVPPQPFSRAHAHHVSPAVLRINQPLFAILIKD